MHSDPRGDKGSISKMIFPIGFKIITINMIWYNLPKKIDYHSFWSGKMQILEPSFIKVAIKSRFFPSYDPNKQNCPIWCSTGCKPFGNPFVPPLDWTGDLCNDGKKCINILPSLISFCLFKNQLGILYWRGFCIMVTIFSTSSSLSSPARLWRSMSAWNFKLKCQHTIELFVMSFYNRKMTEEWKNQK